MKGVRSPKGGRETFPRSEVGKRSNVVLRSFAKWGYRSHKREEVTRRETWPNLSLEDF